VLGDLGWREKRVDEVIEVVTSPSIVRRVVGRILEGATHEVFEGTQEEIRKLEQDAREH
jgi:hypothetical protein